MCFTKFMPLDFNSARHGGIINIMPYCDEHTQPYVHIQRTVRHANLSAWGAAPAEAFLEWVSPTRSLVPAPDGNPITTADVEGPTLIRHSFPLPFLQSSSLEGAHSRGKSESQGAQQGKNQSDLVCKVWKPGGDCIYWDMMSIFRYVHWNFN